MKTWKIILMVPHNSKMNLIWDFDRKSDSPVKAETNLILVIRSCVKFSNRSGDHSWKFCVHRDEGILTDDLAHLLESVVHIRLPDLQTIFCSGAGKVISEFLIARTSQQENLRRYTSRIRGSSSSSGCTGGVDDP